MPVTPARAAAPRTARAAAMLPRSESPVSGTLGAALARLSGLNRRLSRTFRTRGLRTSIAPTLAHLVSSAPLGQPRPAGTRMPNSLAGAVRPRAQGDRYANRIHMELLERRTRPVTSSRNGRAQRHARLLLGRRRPQRPQGSHCNCCANAHRWRRPHRRGR